MPHADSSTLPDYVKTKQELWGHIYEQLKALVEGQRHWISNCANASSLIYHTLLASSHFGPGENAVNWCGFYIDARLFPVPLLSGVESKRGEGDSLLLLGPFCGRPACQFINTTPGKAKGVCADSFIRSETVVVPDVEAYPGHIACDGKTKSELVSPLIYEGSTIGVLDLDCLALGGFDNVDKLGVERIARLVVDSSYW
ncbi:GAF domain-like protein [Schizopora paradoxa]|uniref:GAF domain-like protein n=1 Tax=Schizopora paradoxa TaxID=27342 RepID=A0A0H2RIE2_9AGAM|nr:GAF domain-like protein [Schizopora paradoxa]